MNIEFAIYDLIEQSGRPIIIYPFGANGVIAESVLKRLGREYLIADGNKSHINSLIETVENIKIGRKGLCPGVVDWDILFTCTNEKYYWELRYYVESIFPNSNVLDLRRFILEKKERLLA